MLFRGIVLIALTLIVVSHGFRGPAARGSDSDMSTTAVGNAMLLEYSRLLGALDADTINPTVSLTEATSTTPPSTPIPSPSPFDEWAHGRMP